MLIYVGFTCNSSVEEAGTFESSTPPTPDPLWQGVWYANHRAQWYKGPNPILIAWSRSNMTYNRGS